MSWRGQTLDRDAVAVGPVADRAGRSGRSRASRPSRSRRPSRGRTGRRGTPSDSSSSRMIATSSSTVRRPSSSVARSCASAAQAHASTALGWLPACAGELVRREAGRAGGRGAARTDRARCRGRSATSGGSRRGWRSGRRIVRRGASLPIVAWRTPATGARPVPLWSAAATMQRSGRPRGSGDRWTPTARCSPPWPTTSMARSRRSSWSTRTDSTRSRCACSAIRATPRRPPRTRSFAPTGHSPATTRRGSASCVSGRGWRRSCSTCVARGSARRRVGAGLAVARRGAARRAGATDRCAPAARPRRRATRDAANDWAGLLRTLPAAYRSAVVLRHVDGLSYPELATALGRPEGTVKAQVHRGVALLRTALEAAQRQRTRGDDRMTTSRRATSRRPLAALRTTAPDDARARRSSPRSASPTGTRGSSRRSVRSIVAWNGLGVSDGRGDRRRRGVRGAPPGPDRAPGT